MKQSATGELLRPRDMVVSPDGRWMWNGVQWLPLWVGPAPVRGKVPHWLVVTGSVWLGALTAWEIALVMLIVGIPVATTGMNVPVDWTKVYIMAGLVGLAVVATVGWGIMVGRRGESHWLWPAGGIGTALLLFGYAIAMIAAPATGGGDNDNAAGAGIVILAIPTAAIVFALLWLGAGIGVLWRRLRTSG
jgi:hypothetical protein